MQVSARAGLPTIMKAVFDRYRQRYLKILPGSLNRETFLLWCRSVFRGRLRERPNLGRNPEITLHEGLGETGAAQVGEPFSAVHLENQATSATQAVEAKPTRAAPLGGDLRLGAERRKDGVRYGLWAPRSSSAEVIILSPSGKHLRSVALTACGNGIHRGFDQQGRRGDLYKFHLNGGEMLPDPFSRWQPAGVHNSSMVIHPGSYRWTDETWQRPSFRDLVIYELHVGTFTAKGTFRSTIDRLAHLRDLGVTAIELMPIGEFAGARNWGYDGVHMFAPSRAYGHPEDLRALVNAAHRHQLAVILDVVYNHFGPDGNHLAAYVGEYLDEAAKTPWGGAIRYGDPAFRPLREVVISNPGYWMDEFHIDGFRLDATHAIVDRSPRHILEEITSAIHQRGGYAIAEDARNDVRLTTARLDGGFGFDAVWADDFHHVIRVANTHEAEGYLADFEGTLSEAAETLQHGWLFRGQESRSQGGGRGTPCRHLPPERFVHCISNHDQTGNHAFGERLSHRILPTARRAAEALLCLTPYTPLLFMGQEWAATTPFLFFTDHNPALGKCIVAGRREEFRHFAAFRQPEMLEKIPDPQLPRTFAASKLMWKERLRKAHAQTLALYRSCLALRASDPAFRPPGRNTWQVEILSCGLGAVRLWSPINTWLIIFDLIGGHVGSFADEAIFHGETCWETVLSSNETRFGGEGGGAVNLAAKSLHFPAPETVVLRAVK